MHRLAALAAKQPRRVVGLMSGTSADGIDAVLVELWGCGESTRYEVLSFATTPLPSALRREVFALFAEDASLDALCRVNFALGEAFATAALAALEQAALGPDALDLIGSHGQTVRHLPASGSTLQIGEPAVIAARTGAVTIADFRAADLAVGGEGAPLVPLADHLLFAQPHEGRLLLNIGGIANVTALPANAAASAIRAFDLGPGNMLIDAAVAHYTGGRERFDRGGQRAARGRIDEGLLAELMRTPFLQREPPKSTGREEFGERFLAEVLRREPGRADDLIATSGTSAELRWTRRREPGRADDLIATLTAFTVQSIAEGIDRFCPGEFAALWVGGGGVHNPRIMAGLRRALPRLVVRSLAELGVDPDAREALAFAVLANETLLGRTGNIPAATRAQRPVVLGKIALP